MKTTIITILILTVLGAFSPLSGEEPPLDRDQRTAPITVNLIVDGSQALSGVINELSSQLSESLIDGILQNGDRITVWSAGKTAQILYSETIKTENDRENIKKILKSLPAQGDSADFSGALQKAAAQNTGRDMELILLVNVSYNTLSPAFLGSQASLLRFSRVEEYNGWRMLVIAPDIGEKVRRAAAAYFSGS